MKCEDECEGKDRGVAEAEYTMVVAQENDTQCSQDSIETTASEMIAYMPNKERVIINLVQLVSAAFPAGSKSNF